MEENCTTQQKIEQFWKSSNNEEIADRLLMEATKLEVQNEKDESKILEKWEQWKVYRFKPTRFLAKIRTRKGYNQDSGTQF